MRTASGLLAVLLAIGAGSGVRAGEQGEAAESSGEVDSLDERLRRVRERLRRDQRELDAILEQRRRRAERDAGALQRLERQLADLDERLGYLEEDFEGVLGVQDRLLQRTERDRLQWSASYRVVVNNFHLVDDTADTVTSHLELVLDDYGQPLTDPATGDPLLRPVTRQRPRNIDAWYGSQWLNRLRLTMTWNATENLRFYGQIGVFKYFNELKSHPTTLDMHSNRYPRDPTLRIERAYFDWFVTDWLVLTAGRVASPEGPPAELKENTVRNATWGVQMVEAELEAVLVTLHLSRYLPGTYLRLFYVPFANHTDFTLNDDRSLFRDGGIDPMHAWGAVFELRIPELGDNLVQLGFVNVPQFRPRDIPIEVPGLDEPIEPDEPSGQDLGAYWMATGLVEFKDIGGSGLDLFAGYTMSILKPEADRMVYQVPVELPVVHPTSGEQVDVYSGRQRIETGLASYEEGSGSTNLGHMFYAGFRFTLPWLDAYAPRFGAEMNRGSKYHINWNSPSDLLVNRLGTKGWAWEVYYIQQLIPEHLFARLGYLQLIREYEGLYIGPTTAVDQTIDNAYLLLEARW